MGFPDITHRLAADVTVPWHHFTWRSVGRVGTSGLGSDTAQPCAARAYTGRRDVSRPARESELQQKKNIGPAQQQAAVSPTEISWLQNAIRSIKTRNRQERQREE